jgi:AraC-like DNA-binding protein
MNYLYLYDIALLNGLVLMAALLSRRENRFPNFLLCLLFAVALFSQWVIVLSLTGMIEKYPLLLRFRFATTLLVPSLFFLYVLALTTPNFKWVQSYWIHFAPFLLGLVAYALLTLGSRKVENWQVDPSFLEQRYFFLLISVVLTGTYLVMSLMRIRKFQALLPDYFSDWIHVRLSWLRVLLILFVIPWFIELLDVLMGPSVILVEKAMLPVVLVSLLLIGFFGLRQSVIFSKGEEWGARSSHSANLKETISVDEKETRTTVFSQEELDRWRGRIEEFVNEKKPYLRPEYRLFDLARDLNLRSYQVSEILNRGVGLRFYDFINQYRVKEAKSRLLDPSLTHLKILAIAMDCGFNSKSSFNDTFRKFTGLTPSQFRNDSTEKPSSSC